MTRHGANASASKAPLEIAASQGQTRWIHVKRRMSDGDRRVVGGNEGND
jgi:hypothetical protein